MQFAKVRLSEVDRSHVQVVELLSDRLRRLTSEDCTWDLLRHQTVNVPVVVGQLPCIFKVVEDLLTQSAQFSCKWNLSRIDVLEIDLAWFVKNHLWLDVLVGRLILWVKGTLIAHVPILDASQVLVTVLGILLLEVINDLLLDSDFVVPPLLDNLCRLNLNVDLRAEWPEICREPFLPTQGVMWVKHIEWL